MTVILFMQHLLKGIFVFTLNLIWLEFDLQSFQKQSAF